MSRTFRRKADWIRLQVVGQPEDIDQRDLKLYDAVDREVAYKRKLAWLHRDSGHGRFGSPSYFRRQHGAKRYRTRWISVKHNHLTKGSWDNHSNDPFPSNAGWFWF